MLRSKSIWLQALQAPAVLCVVALLVAWSAGARAAYLTLACGALLLVGYHVLNLNRLYRWLHRGGDERLPDAFGVWEHVFATLHRSNKIRSEQREQINALLEDFRKASEAMPDGMVILDQQNAIKWFNRQAETHLGLQRERDIGAPIGNLVRHPAFGEFLLRDELGEALEVKALREANTTLSLRLLAYGAEQKLLMSYDISRIAAADTVRRDFIANVSHELRTPLTVLSGFLEIVDEAPTTPEQREKYLALLRQQVQSMTNLVEDLLTLSALESSDYPLTESWLEVDKLVAQVDSTARAMSGGRHKISVRVPPHAQVLGSEKELLSAWSNLAANAVRYTAEQGNIVLAWQEEGDEGAFSVSDTGIGIAEEHIPRLTERFYRVDRGRSRSTGGTGLGLAIVKHVALRHQAQLQVESEVGRGSTFAMRFAAGRWRRVETPALAAAG